MRIIIKVTLATLASPLDSADALVYTGFFITSGTA